MKIMIVNKENQVLFEQKGEIIDLYYEKEYKEGDKIIIHKKDTDFLAIQLDELIMESIIYTPSSSVEFKIPFDRIITQVLCPYIRN